MNAQKPLRCRLGLHAWIRLRTYYRDIGYMVDTLRVCRCCGLKREVARYRIANMRPMREEH